MSGNSPKQLEAKPRNAQRSIKSGNACGPRTPTDGVAAIPDQGRGQASDRGSLTIELKPFGVLENALVENLAVAYCRQNAIERQLNRAIYSLKENRCLSHANTLETPPIDQN